MADGFNVFPMHGKLNKVALIAAMRKPLTAGGTVRRLGQYPAAYFVAKHRHPFVSFFNS